MFSNFSSNSLIFKDNFIFKFQFEFVVNEVKDDGGSAIGKAKRQAQLDLTELMRKVIKKIKLKKEERQTL